MLTACDEEKSTFVKRLFIIEIEIDHGISKLFSFTLHIIIPYTIFNIARIIVLCRKYIKNQFLNVHDEPKLFCKICLNRFRHTCQFETN